MPEKIEDTTKGLSTAKKAEAHLTSYKNSKGNLEVESLVKELGGDARYYFLKEQSYEARFRQIYLENYDLLNKYGINTRKYYEYLRDSFDRYKNVHNLMPFEPMKLKAFQYVESSALELIQMMSQKLGKV